MGNKSLRNLGHMPKMATVLGVRISGMTQFARWRSCRASDSESRGPWFEPHRRHRVVSLSKTH